MEFEPKDTDLIQLLKKLKDSNQAYPQEMLASRRQGYLKQVAEVSGAAGLAMGLRNTVKRGGGAGTGPAAGTLVEALLVIAIIAEAGAVAYFYRDKAAEFIRSLTNSPTVEMVSTEPVLPSPSLIPEVEETATPVFTEVETETATPVSTPSLELAGNPTVQSKEDTGDPPSTSNTTSNTGGGSGTSPSVSTPDPNGNNGNHYGQTPKPERTKEPGNDNSDENTETEENSTSDPKKKK